MASASEVLFPTSPADAAAAFGDGAGVTVIAGGTIVMPDISYGRLDPAKAIVLTRAGLAGGHAGRLDRHGRRRRRRSRSSSASRAARAVRRQRRRPRDPRTGDASAETCARARAPEAPRGDLQGALLALDAIARSAGAGGETTEPLEDFLADHGGRLLLDV